MAKKQDISILNPPSIPSKGILPNDFVLITEQNRTNAIQIGRILYYIEINPNKITGYTIINPCLTKGWRKIPNCPFELEHPYINGKTHWNCFFDENMNYDYWAKTWKIIIDSGIEKKNLYIRITDPILIYK
jgi:hypothetical protein